MPFPLFRPLRAVTAIAVLSSLLSGCSFHGSYPDATESDAAKLRFISNTQNSTLDVYDAQHCEGQTTGMLNNMFVVDTRRRAAMSVAPPADARGYLEVKLKPGKDTFVLLNTNGGYYVCGNAFNFTPQPGEEYEVTLNAGPGQCMTQLQLLKHVNGKDVRRPIPMFSTGLTACAGRAPLFPKSLADTPQRIDLINRIVEASSQTTLLLYSKDLEGQSASPEKLDTLIAERKVLMGEVKLPDDYWAQYRQNLIAFFDEESGIQARTLKFYKDIYRKRLERTEDEVLEHWLQPTDEALRARVLANNKLMVAYYENTGKSVKLETINHHLQRMSQLDERYGVCARFEKCWQ
ncbi:hypothetical protein [Pseudomonas sp. NA-150]|uniref:hypothetical protein n=1 Tax=Pseudomonas sp. NA-150 TaxID=3367525 RepID=UPI0037C6C927